MSSDDLSSAEEKAGDQTAKTEAAKGDSVAIEEVSLNESLLRRHISLCQADQDHPTVAKPNDFPNQRIHHDDDLILMGICGPIHGGTNKEDCTATTKQGSATNNGRTPRWTPEEVRKSLC